LFVAVHLGIGWRGLQDPIAQLLGWVQLPARLLVEQLRVFQLQMHLCGLWVQCLGWLGLQA
jgi:hypothetical protein